jgi:hypothetical protein
MEKSLFQNDSPEDKRTPTPMELIEKEVVHLKKGSSVRHGAKGASGSKPWIAMLALLGLAWLYLMDPILHAWYKGEAIHAYLYLHSFDAGPTAANLLASHILSEEDIETLNRRNDPSVRDYYKSPDVAVQRATVIIEYMAKVKLLHEGDYKTLDPVGRMRCVLFVRSGLVLPTDWSFLDPSVGD